MSNMPAMKMPMKTSGSKKKKSGQDDAVLGGIAGRKGGHAGYGLSRSGQDDAILGIMGGLPGGHATHGAPTLHWM